MSHRMWIVKTLEDMTHRLDQIEKAQTTQRVQLAVIVGLASFLGWAMPTVVAWASSK